MGSRIPSHQLSNGLYVSGRPEQQKERRPTTAARAVPYTGGDIKKSGELGKMFDISVEGPPASSSKPPQVSKPSRSSSLQKKSSKSGPIPKSTHSGPIPKKFSGQLTTPIQPTRLITSSPLRSSGPMGSSGQVDQDQSSSPVGRVKYGSAVTKLTEDSKSGFKGWVKRGLLGFVQRYPDAELRGAVDGQFVKVTGVVTCGSIPLKSSYKRVPRCVYVSTELHEYRKWGGKSANPKHRYFSWGCRHSEKHAADFYISDFQSGLRALVKAGYGSKVTPFVKPTTIVDTRKENQEVSSRLPRWLSDRNLSSDDRIMRLKEGYIKEGSTASVVGVVRRQDNVLMIVPPPEPISTGFQWSSFLLPTQIKSLILKCDDNQDDDVIPV